jgi:DNA-binding NarL/FixJ family response regulator
MGKPTGTAGNYRILVVEDNALFRQAVKGILHDQFPFIEIYEAFNGEEALQQVEILRPQLMFVDLRLPGENGVEVTRKIKDRYPNIIVAMLTGYDLPEYKEASWQHCDYFVSKQSMLKEDILALVESVLAPQE